LEAKWAKAARQRKHHGWKKKTLITLCSNLEIAEGDDVVIDEDVDE
jgi:hypothetical protein